MDQNVKELVRSIEDLGGELKRKEAELESIRKNCHHLWPKEWSEKVGRDYRFMSGAVDPSCRRSTPEIIAIQYKICEICGKEKTKE